MNKMKFGRKPTINKPRIRLRNVLTGVVPDHPIAADYLANLSNWQMLGNDQYGDCVAVTWANIRRLTTAVLAGKNGYPTLDQVLALYKTQNPNFPTDDNGMNIQTCLEYLVNTGGPDGVKALGFASVDLTNPEEVKAAIAIFGCVWTGVWVLKVNMDQFNAGKPWDYSSRSPREGGHSIITGGYGSGGKGALGGDEKFITWGQETSFTDKFWLNEVDEAWVVIWPEHLGNKSFMAGVDMVAFAAAYEQITGKTFPVVIPTPAPMPIPTPVSLTKDFTLTVKSDGTTLTCLVK